MTKLNKTEKKLLESADAQGWIKCPDQRPTTKAAFKSLREKGLVEYKVTEKWAGNKLTRKALIEIL